MQAVGFVVLTAAFFGRAAVIAVLGAREALDHRAPDRGRPMAGSAAWATTCRCCRGARRRAAPGLPRGLCTALARAASRPRGLGARAGEHQPDRPGGAWLLAVWVARQPQLAASADELAWSDAIRSGPDRAAPHRPVPRRGRLDLGLRLRRFRVGRRPGRPAPSDRGGLPRRHRGRRDLGRRAGPAASHARPRSGRSAMLVVDPALPTPPFEQIKAQITTQRASGELPANHRLPPSGTWRLSSASPQHGGAGVSRARGVRHHRDARAAGVVRDRHGLLESEGGRPRRGTTWRASGASDWTSPTRSAS